MRVVDHKNSPQPTTPEDAIQLMEGTLSWRSCRRGKVKSRVRNIVAKREGGKDDGKNRGWMRRKDDG